MLRGFLSFYSSVLLFFPHFLICSKYWHMLTFPGPALLPSGNGISILVYGWSGNVVEPSRRLAFKKPAFGKLVYIKFP
ncbi:predicted protein [Methanosarcina acetivorans C2A]|uniref:Uncharacterized protein n=1 Tax=Methanosarcina acetivorans (strain ATCC 35395 / DSM 2834 / JCM 12185 / C2A) TaxID=188937 RepID=Q8TL46_METAC|nr:predicted protein [Methanosarcina acetivorans C2A]